MRGLYQKKKIYIIVCDEDNEMNQLNKIKIALAQTQIVWEDKESNYRIAGKQIREAAGRGAEAIFFPEMSFTGFSMNIDHTKESGERTIGHMQALARQYHVSIGFGWVKGCTNTCSTMRDKCENHYTIVDAMGNVLSDYVKIHPFSYSGENLKFQGGSALAYFMLNGIPCSSFICYDLRFPEIFQAASKKAHVIIVAADWPAKRSAHWKALLRARAIENQVYILAVNCVGEIGGVHYTGDSCVIDPDGEINAELSQTEGIIELELTDDVERFREVFPVKQDRKEELYARLLRE